MFQSRQRLEVRSSFWQGEVSSALRRLVLAIARRNYQSLQCRKIKSRDRSTARMKHKYVFDEAVMKFNQETARARTSIHRTFDHRRTTNTILNMSVKRTILQSLPIPQLPGWESRLVMLEYAPGLAAPVHKHPVAATGFIVEGDVISHWEGGEIETYTTGDSFIDHGEIKHLRSENASKDRPLKMIVSYVIKVGEPNVQMT